jgi:predicted DNA-binding antitoxin AbrB/MazE fold protein
MQEVIHAVYRNGAFVPVVPCSLPEETEVEVRVRNGADIIPPLEPDPAKRAKIRREVVERMHNNPIPLNAPRFTRDELHERR